MAAEFFLFKDVTLDALTFKKLNSIACFSDDAYRLPIETAPGLPKIPSHPISARDAKQFLRYWFSAIYRICVVVVL